MSDCLTTLWKQISICALIVFVLHVDSAYADDGANSDALPMVTNFLKQSCSDCHNAETAEGGLNLDLLPWQLKGSKNREQWILIHDRIEKGEMPPPDASELSEKDRHQLLSSLSKAIYKVDYSEVVTHGRGPMRRLNRSEYETNIRELLKLPHLDIRDMLPEDREGHHFNKSAETLDMSRVQLAAYLDATDFALREAMAVTVAPRKPRQQKLLATRMFAAANTYGGREAMFYAKNSQMVPLSGAELGKIRKTNNHDPEMELAIFRSPSWPYYGYPDSFRAVEAGAYRIRFSARAVRQVRNFRLRPATATQPMTFRARKRSGPDVSGDVRATGGVIDVQPESAVYETIVRLKQNETFEYSLLGLAVPRAINPPNGQLYYDFPPMPDDGHPGIAFQWLEVTGPLDSETWPPPSHKILFDDLPIRPAGDGQQKAELVSNQPRVDAVGLLRRFIRRAEREPISDDVIKVYESLVLTELEQGASLSEALLTGYSAFLCSGHYLYLREPVIVADDNEVDHYAIAERLSHFLGNAPPDTTLKSHATHGRLGDSHVLQAETDRLIECETFEKFIDNFTDYWLSLKDIRRDEPDARLYPEYRFDDYLIESMEAETRAFFGMIVRDNLPITVLIDANFALVNDRLAKHYELRPVTGSYLRRVELPESSSHGGLLTQAAIMKVTANGSTTSPVIRGAWIMDRIMGNPPPPPPEKVPAVEPDIRGATTIREQLAKHAKEQSCASCHARFDPVGFALENFDIMGAWRGRYRSLKSGVKVTGIDRAGHNYSYHVAGAIDASGQLLDGSTFQNIDELKAILVSQPRQLARNMLHQFSIYATGTPVRFSDRPVLEEILDRCQDDGYRTRDLLHQFVQSRIFLGTKSTDQRLTQSSK